MTPVLVYAFENQAAAAAAMALRLGVRCLAIALHRFPDGEARPRVAEPAETAILYASLDDPDAKLVPLLLAADACRRLGASRLVLVAPYLCYMRQDRVFQPGEPLSRDVIGGLLGGVFDRIVTVDAHMHRTRDLSAVFGGIEVDDLSAAGLIADAFDVLPSPIVAGPDAESAPWARRIAERLGADLLVLEKQRCGDAMVRLDSPSLAAVRGRAVLLVDDICSSGATLAAAASALRDAGAASVDVGVTHALFDAAAARRLASAGVRRVVSTNAVRHPTNGPSLAALIARSLHDELPR